MADEDWEGFRRAFDWYEEPPLREGSIGAEQTGPSAEGTPSVEPDHSLREREARPLPGDSHAQRVPEGEHESRAVRVSSPSERCRRCSRKLEGQLAPPSWAKDKSLCRYCQGKA